MECSNNKVTEIRWHARGGQGAVTASKTLVEMILPKNMYFQSFPEYGPERMGPPRFRFLTVSVHPPHIGLLWDYRPGCDFGLRYHVDGRSRCYLRFKENGIIIVNTSLNPPMNYRRPTDYRIIGSIPWMQPILPLM